MYDPIFMTDWGVNYNKFATLDTLQDSVYCASTQACRSSYGCRCRAPCTGQGLDPTWGRTEAARRFAEILCSEFTETRLENVELAVDWVRAVERRQSGLSWGAVLCIGYWGFRGTLPSALYTWRFCVRCPRLLREHAVAVNKAIMVCYELCYCTGNKFDIKVSISEVRAMGVKTNLFFSSCKRAAHMVRFIVFVGNTV